MNKETMKIYEEVNLEMDLQNAKWGEQNHPCLDDSILSPYTMTAYYGIPSEKMAKIKLEMAAEKDKLTYAHILIEELCEAVSEFDINKRREELVQLAAVTIQWIKKIDREINK